MPRDSMMIGIDRSPDDKIVRVWTRCDQHGEFTYEVPVEHLAMLAQAFNVVNFHLRGSEGLLDALHAANEIATKMQEAVSAVQQKRTETDGHVLTADQVKELIAKLNMPDSGLPS